MYLVREFEILDILQFLAPGYNLKSFFKAFDANEETVSSPMTIMNLLINSMKPYSHPYETFYSTIKGCNVLEEDYATFQKLINQGKSEQEALQISRLQEIPKTGPENYQWLQQLWVENQWSTFADYLKWYNDLDVNPMIQAIEKMNDYYKDKNVDLCLSHHFAWYCQENLFEFHHRSKCGKSSLQSKITGHISTLQREHRWAWGPSIIYHRNQQAHKSFIHNNPNKPCKSIVGYDANALYLHVLSMNLPTQIPLIRREENEFKKEFPGLLEGCRDWIDWLIHDRNIKFQSALHGGGEKKIGSYKVDGFCQELNTVFDFMVIIGMHTPIFFLMRMLNTLLESMMTKIIPLLPLKKLETMIVNVYSIYRTRATVLKSSGRVIGIHLLKVVLKSKPTFHNFSPLLTLKRLSPKTKLFNTSKTDTCLDSSNVTFTHLNISKITFQK